MKRITHPNQIPKHMTKVEEAEFWSTHELAEEALEMMTVDNDTHDDLLLPKRSKNISTY